MNILFRRHGRANAETAGARRIALPGGLPDFATGARRATGGASILTLHSTAGRVSSIVSRLRDTFTLGRRPFANMRRKAPTQDRSKANGKFSLEAASSRFQLGRFRP